MKTAKVLYANRLSCMPDEEVGTHPVIKVMTDLPAGVNNCFYIDLVDLKKVPIVLSFDHPPSNTVNPEEMNSGDSISFDVQDGFHKAVIWNNRKIRQKEYSFDDYAIINKN